MAKHDGMCGSRRRIDDSPGGDLISAVDDVAGDPGHQDGVLDVFGPLAQVRAGDGHNSAALHRTRNWVQLKNARVKKKLVKSSLLFLVFLFKEGCIKESSYKVNDGRRAGLLDVVVARVLVNAAGGG